ncbi:hypothetical protein [Echinicola rosea]|nr:hypothetical protein [Echinicola rosea]
MNRQQITTLRELLDLAHRWMPVLKAKGYDGAYHCQAAHPGKFTSSIRAFIKGYLKGEETYPNEGILMGTYLQWQGEGHPHTTAYLKLEPNEKGNWRLAHMELCHQDRFGWTIKERRLSPGDIRDIPSRKLAISMVNPMEQQKSRRYGI